MPVRRDGNEFGYRAAGQRVPGGVPGIIGDGHNVGNGHSGHARGNRRGDAGCGVFKGDAVVDGQGGVRALEQFHGGQVGLRVWLSLGDGVPCDDKLEIRLGEARNDFPGQGAFGHGHEGAPDTCLMELVQQFAGARPPGHTALHAADDFRREGVDDFPGFQVHAGILEDAGGVGQRLSDKLHGLLVRPGPAVGFNQRMFGRDPVGLGVHNGAIHVPKDCFEGGNCGWGSHVFSLRCAAGRRLWATPLANTGHPSGRDSGAPTDFSALHSMQDAGSWT